MAGSSSGNWMLQFLGAMTSNSAPADVVEPNAKRQRQMEPEPEREKTVDPDSYVPVEEPELRVDKNDGMLYPKESFIYVYDGTAEWDKAEPERRIDVRDGQKYTQKEFFKEYGRIKGIREWDAAKEATQIQAMMDSMSEQDKQVYYETLKAQEKMQAEQVKFMEQVRDEEIIMGTREIKKDCRFVDDFRPTTLCRFHMKGWCQKEDKCPYAHDYDELHPVSPELPGVQEGQCSWDSKQNDKEPVDGKAKKIPTRMKEKKNLCQQYERGECLLGKICGFAHGQREVGVVGPAVVGYVKSILCTNHKLGKCPSGANCERAHHESEIGQQRPPPSLMFTSPSKRPKHLPLFKCDLKNLSYKDRREYEEHLKLLDDMRQTDRYEVEGRMQNISH